MELDHLKWIFHATPAAGHRLQNAFGGRYMVGCTGIDFHRHTQRPTKSLENGFNLVVRILAADVVDMQRDHRVIHEALEKFMEQIDVKVAHRTFDELHVVIETRSTGEIHHHRRAPHQEGHTRGRSDGCRSCRAPDLAPDPT